jgi:hypothetical protein
LNLVAAFFLIGTLPFVLPILVISAGAILEQLIENAPELAIFDT